MNQELRDKIDELSAKAFPIIPVVTDSGRVLDLDGYKPEREKFSASLYQLVVESQIEKLEKLEQEYIVVIPETFPTSNRRSIEAVPALTIRHYVKQLQSQLSSIGESK